MARKHGRIHSRGHKEMVDNSSYVDINIFVYWLGNHPTFGETAYKWIKKIEDSPRGKYVTSSLTLYETLVIIAGLTGKSLKDKDFTKAVDLMKEYNLDYEDSIHLAVALRTGVQEIISNDKDFDVAPIKRNM